MRTINMTIKSRFPALRLRSVPMVSEVLSLSKDEVEPSVFGTSTPLSADGERSPEPVEGRSRTIGSRFSVPGLCLLVIVILSGCAEKDNLRQAQDYSAKSRRYYAQAVNLYKGLIAKGSDLDILHFELGRLYYAYGEFNQAVAEFSRTGLAGAKKFLAISYYRLGNFTDALEAFSGMENMDEESLYHYGLTCEKLNLFDQALGAYKKIGSREFAGPAGERINLIQKQASPGDIREKNPELARILSNAPPEENYPQAGALILSYDENIEITPANTQVSTLHYVIKILNERGKQEFSESQIDYDSTYEKVELEYARTIRPDGAIVEVGTRHLRDVSRYLNFPLYSNARVYIISFPEISEGAVIEYKVRIYRSQLVNKKDFVLGYSLQAAEPVIFGNFSIALPEDKKLRIRTLNEEYNDFQANLKPEIRQKEGRLIYSWHFKEIPQIIPESNMPAVVEINPAIIISSFDKWQDIYDWWWQLAKDKIKADAAIKETVKALTKGLESEEEKLRALYNFCAQKIRYVAIEYGQAGYEPHSAGDVFANKYGDCKDKAILLITMLREAGFPDSWPVLISTRDYYNLNGDFPSILFNHAIAGVLLKGKIIFLDPTAETASFGDLPVDDQGRRVLLFRESGYEIQETPLYQAGHNLIRQSFDIKVNADESITAGKEVFTLGMYGQAQRYWLLYTPPELIEERLKERLQEVSIGAKLDSYDIKNLDNLNEPITLSYKFSGPEYFTSAGPLRIAPQLVNLDMSLAARDKRRYPVDFAAPDVKETVFEIEIPENFTIKYMPENVTGENPWLKFAVEYKLQDNRIFFRQRAELKKKAVTRQEYPDFKRAFEELAKKIKQRLILEKK